MSQRGREAAARVLVPTIFTGRVPEEGEMPMCGPQRARTVLDLKSSEWYVYRALAFFPSIAQHTVTSITWAAALTLEEDCHISFESYIARGFSPSFAWQ